MSATEQKLELLEGKLKGIHSALRNQTLRSEAIAAVEKSLEYLSGRRAVGGEIDEANVATLYAEIAEKVDAVNSEAAIAYESLADIQAEIGSISE